MPLPGRSLGCADDREAGTASVKCKQQLVPVPPPRQDPQRLKLRKHHFGITGSWLLACGGIRGHCFRQHMFYWTFPVGTKTCSKHQSPSHPLPTGHTPLIHEALTCSQGCAGSTLKGCSPAGSRRQIWHPGRHSAGFPEPNSENPKQKVSLQWENLT